MKITNQLKRVLSLFLCVIMLVGVLPVSAFAAETGTTVVIAGSDYQNTNGGYFSSGASTNAYAIMSQIKEDYPDAYGFLFGGDYYAHDTNTTTYSTNGKKQLKEEIVDVLYPDMADDTQIYIQGNHDADSLTTNGTLATSGAHDTDYYGVYVINEKDYMWYNDSPSTIKSTASALSSYLDAKLDDGYSKPIFVLSHLPLHYSTRTVNEGDGKYAKYIYDVLDEAGENGLHIIFMYGHNHSTSYYEAYLGNGAVYLAEGSTIAIANEGSQSSYFTDTLNFTYMNYGFTGYLTGTAADGALTMTVFEITGDKVAVKRYDSSGPHNLKSAGVATNIPSGLSPDTTVIGTAGATISLTAPKEKTSCTDNDVTVTAVGLTGITVTKAEAPTYNSALYSGYEEYTITATGYEAGNTATVTIALSDSDFDISRTVTVKFPDGHTEEIAVTNDTVTFETKEMGTFTLMQNKSTGVEAPDAGTEDTADGNIWRQVDSFTAGKKYILVNYGENASGVGTYAINSSAAPTTVNVQSDSTGAYIENSNMAIAWLATANEGQFELTNADTGYYLYTSSYPSGTSGVNLSVAKSVTSGSNYSNWSMESNSNTASALSVRRATSSNYYPVRYSNGGTEFLVYTSTQTSKYDNWVVIFEQTSEGGSSETVIPDEEDGWVSLPSGGTYVLDTDGIDTGASNKYIIVGSSSNYALTVSNGSVSQAAVTISDNTLSVDDPSVYEFYFADNSSNESGSYLLTQDGSNTVYHSNGNMYYGSDNKGYWHISSGSNGSYQLYDYDNRNWYLNYGYVWSSESVSRFAVSSNTRSVRLYKCVSSVSEDTFLRLAGETEQIYATSAKVTQDTVLKKAYIEVTTDGYYLSDIVALTSDMITWAQTFDGTTAGTYVGTVTYEGQQLGAVTVTITAEHTYETVTVEATCTEDGSITTTCTICGESAVEVIKALGHDYDCVVTNATCGEDGSSVYTCSVCEDTYTEVIPATDEHQNETTTVDATCVEKGSVTITCTVCGNTTAEETDALGHDYEVTASANATCTETGATTYTCSVCGSSYSEVIAATGHSYSSTVIAATCTETGFTSYVCDVCGHSYTDAYTDALDHDYDSEISATCTNTGFIVYTCKTCGHSYNGEEVAALGHDYEFTVVAPNCSKDGYTIYTCKTCGDAYIGDYVAAPGHTYGSVVTAATCTEGGFTTYTCTTCGNSYVDDHIAALGHDYDSVVTEPTFEEMGYTTHTCTVCGDVVVDSYVPVLSHTYETVTVNATCTEDGSVTYTCTTCGYSYTDILSATGHTYKIAATTPTCATNGSVVSTCTTCGHIETEVVPALGHDYEVTTIDPTCTEDGYTIYACACGDIRTEVTPAPGHNHTIVVTDATCTENGSITNTCTVCGNVTTEVTPATGHSFEPTSTAPTCTAGGYTTYACTTCGTSYIADETSALGHAYEAEVTAPTCTAGGITTFTCKVCGHSYTANQVTALGHNYTSEEADGYMVYTCDTCGDSYSEKIQTVSYTKVSSLSSDNSYVITLYSDSKYYALSHEDNNISVVQVTVSDGVITSEITEDLVWEYSNKKLSYEDNSTTYYLYAKSASGWWGWGSTPTLALSTSSSSSVSFSNSKLKVGSYYLQYSNSTVSLNRNATTTYFFIEA